MNLSGKTVLKTMFRIGMILIATSFAIRCIPNAKSQESVGGGSVGGGSVGQEQAGSTVAADSESDSSEEDGLVDPPYKPKTEAELKRSLSAIQFKVTQKEGTEPAFRNKYWDNKKQGIYRCVVCAQSLFSSETKYKSGTGWPSFYDPIKKDHVAYRTDFHLFYPRKEVHCSRCNAHLGHVFDDGPKNATGKRYCMNSAAMTFEPKSNKPNSNKSKR
jgi:methionine-R-sulfoxide reductase